MTFLSSLSNCTFLEELVISYNSFNTTIPSISLNTFLASSNQIKGQIPMGIGSLKNLIFLDLSPNNLTASIPSTLEGFQGLQRLHLSENNIGGNILEELFQLRNLGELFFSHNQISGSIPNCIENLSLLQRLNLSYNGLTLSIPLKLWSLGNLLFLDLSSNYFGGSLSPNMRELDGIIFMNLCRNQIIGNIPSIVGCPIILPQENESVLLGASILGAIAAKKFSSLNEAMKAMNAVDEMVWDFVENRYDRPTTAKSEWDKAALALANANNKAINAIFCGVSIDEFHSISPVKTTKEAWTILETTYEGGEKDLRPLSESLRAKVIAIEESKDFDEIKIQELIKSLQTYELRLPSHKPSKLLALKTINERMDDSSEEDNVKKEVAFLTKNFQKFLKMKNSGKSFSKGKFSSSKGDRKEFKKKDGKNSQSPQGIV
ncbi:probably inactive leucine-rich repeat receptor-like protein kinase IMK2 [Quercus lobata]|uniref:probably inactive leucine-rich repeat receptor-like protein kinase IMK2 n=1 Tax=Quercus lobata TaxID=97700 RepID=UPI001244B17A|nr:probably inactive leucine-rich repeat receptor-like protein kinase IMK2 [Quercus lobata]